ncbi:Sugar phosphate isomerase [Arthrobacter sp. 9AX]|uniref:sugar phosphate isomerase/epimerase family protein n=1 Tax=Arthrobacter sp. 9AX TaxID=2653131 RepID=UPI0012F10C47|nr:TIM barrel protein [Arthrobacter sp. 9AX]VXC24246.1 Sugar phosphate isomerase [Arthrobacter sp. 9AX]
MSDTTLGTPIQGTTLYSFTRFWHGRQMTFEDLVREVARRGLGPGLEIVGFQSIRNFPDVDEAFVNQFKTLIDETGLMPTALGANADQGLRRDRRLTNDELVEYMAAQIDVARRLGFPIVRVQYSLTPDDMERLLPIAERANVTLGMEIHAHHTPCHPVMQALLERYEKLGSPRLGFIPDWGATMVQVPRTLLDTYRRRGIAPELIAAVDDYWHSQHGNGGPDDAAQHKQFEEFVELARRHGAEDIAVELAVNATGLFGHGEIEEWTEILPWAVHTHGKFYELDSDGEEPSVPIRSIISAYVNGGYSRTISSEWEGFHWNDWENSFDVIAAQQKLLRDSAAKSGSRMVTDLSEARALLGSQSVVAR